MTRFFRWFFLLFAIIFLVAVVLYNKSNIQLSGPPRKGAPPAQGQAPSKGPDQDLNKTLENIPAEKKSSPTAEGPPQMGPENSIVAPPDVSVVTLEPATYEAKVNAFGVARAQYELNLKAQVTGQITSISNKFDSGLRLKKGETLLTLDASDYLAALANAKSEVADAKLNLLEAEREAIQAKVEWKAMGLKGKPASQLVLHKPQLEAAKAILKKAEATLVRAQRDQKNTQIITPFNALVVERLVAPGSYVQTGTEVAKLYSSDRMEISLALPASDWKNLPVIKILTEKHWPVQISSVEDEQIWQGEIVRLEQHLDEATRQRTLIIAVDHPFDQSPALFPGTFLQAQIKGRKLEGLWKLPNSALSQRSEIWYVRDDKTISSFLSKIVFSEADSIYISVPTELTNRPQHVLVSPLNSYLQGMLVNPVEQAITSGSSHE